MRTWSTLTPEERRIFTEKNEHGHLLELKERQFLWDLEVTLWLRPLTDKEVFMAREILDFVIDVELSTRAAA